MNCTLNSLDCFSKSSLDIKSFIINGVNTTDYCRLLHYILLIRFAGNPKSNIPFQPKQPGSVQRRFSTNRSLLQQSSLLRLGNPEQNQRVHHTLSDQFGLLASGQEHLRSRRRRPESVQIRLSKRRGNRIVQRAFRPGALSEILTGRRAVRFGLGGRYFEIMANHGGQNVRSVEMRRGRHLKR